jgi:hypothetical protein
VAQNIASPFNIPSIFTFQYFIVCNISINTICTCGVQNRKLHLLAQYCKSFYLKTIISHLAAENDIMLFWHKLMKEGKVKIGLPLALTLQIYSSCAASFLSAFVACDNLSKCLVFF